MTHEAFSNLIDSYLQGKAAPGEREAMDAHLADCPDCRLMLQIRQDSLSLDDHEEAPRGYSSAWREAVHQEEESMMEQNQNQQRKTKKPFVFRRWMAVAAALLLVAGGTLISGRSLRNAWNAGSTPDYAADSVDGYGAYAPQPYPATGDMVPSSKQAGPATLRMEGAGGAGGEEATSPAKIIRTVSLTISTRAFDEDFRKLNLAIGEKGGYIEYSNVSAASAAKRYASITARIPSDKLDAFLEQIQQYGQLGNMTQSQEDVSEKYLDVDTRLKTQTAKIERLQDLLSRATTVSDILNIENEIASTQYQIDRLTGSLRGMDSKVIYSTVSIELYEETLPKLPEKPSLWDRITHAVSDTLEMVRSLLGDAVVFLAAILPYLIALIVLIVIVRLIVKRRKNK